MNLLGINGRPSKKSGRLGHKDDREFVTLVLQDYVIELYMQ